MTTDREEKSKPQDPRRLWRDARWRPLLTRVAARGLASFNRALVGTLDVRAADYEPHCDAALQGFQGPAIYLMWHEYIFLPMAIRRGCDLTLLVGTHADADLLGELAESVGFKTVRGSSTKGGIKAILKYTREHRDTSLVMTPDGPKGPRRELSPGCIQLASLLQMPIIPAGMGFDRPYRYATWDRFAVPRLGSRGRLILGPRVHVPRKLTEEQLARWRDHVQTLLDRLNAEAERWALDGIPRWGERAAFAAPHASAEPSNSLGLIS